MPIFTVRAIQVSQDNTGRGSRRRKITLDAATYEADNMHAAVTEFTLTHTPIPNTRIVVKRGFIHHRERVAFEQRNK